MFNLRLGQKGERIAANYLKKKGWKLIDTNFRTRFGEIDLIFTFESEIIFVEVKTRNSHKFGYPEEAVNAQKIKHLQATAETFLKIHKTQKSPRFDIIAITFEKSTPHIKHLPYIF